MDDTLTLFLFPYTVLLKRHTFPLLVQRIRNMWDKNGSYWAAKAKSLAGSNV